MVCRSICNLPSESERSDDKLNVEDEDEEEDDEDDEEDDDDNDMSLLLIVIHSRSRSNYRPHQTKYQSWYIEHCSPLYE